MIFSSKSLGLELFQNGFAIVLASGSQFNPKIEKYEIIRLPGEVIKPSLKETNIIEPSVLNNALSDSYLKLLTKVKRVSVSIPDAAGRVLLLEVEAPLKNKEEGIDHVKWKLKKSFPIDINDVHLDYQLLRKEENGTSRLIVGLVSKAVISEYEDMILELGLEPNIIDFSAFNLHRLFAPRLDINDNLTFISIYRGVLSVMIFQDGCLDFSRNKALSTNVVDPARLFREISSSLVVYSDSKGGWKPRNVFYYADGVNRDLLGGVLTEAVSENPVHMDTDAIINSSVQQVDRQSLPEILSALGAASRGLR